MLVCHLISGLVPKQILETEHSAKSEIDELEDDLDDTIKPEAVQLFTPEHLAKLYVFAMIWSMGAFLETEDRLKYDVFLKDKFDFLDLPNKGGSANVTDLYL